MDDLSELAASKNVLLNGLAHAGSQLGVIDAACGNTVIHDEPARTQQAPELGKIPIKLGPAHMLEHAYRGNFVVGCAFIEFAIVEQLHAHPAAQTFFFDEPVNVGMLVDRKSTRLNSSHTCSSRM